MALWVIGCSPLVIDVQSPSSLRNNRYRTASHHKPLPAPKTFPCETLAAHPPPHHATANSPNPANATKETPNADHRFDSWRNPTPPPTPSPQSAPSPPRNIPPQTSKQMDQQNKTDKPDSDIPSCPCKFNIPSRAKRNWGATCFSPKANLRSESRSKTSASSR